MSQAKQPPKIPPPVQLEEGCEPLAELPFQIGSGRNLLSGEGITTGASAHGKSPRLRMKLFKRISDQHLLGRVWFGPGADGPPGHAHGGAIAYVLDEAMGSVAWANDYPVVAAGLQFEYLAMTPLEEDLILETWVEKTVGRRLHVQARLSLLSGQICVNAQGQFAILSRSRVEKLFANIAEDQMKANRHWLNHPFKWSSNEPG